tara:strand:- start:48631 stop:48759 length:129 start_codon:yes stop_codon:yes gene_type:complete
MNIKSTLNDSFQFVEMFRVFHMKKAAPETPGQFEAESPVFVA